MERRNALVVGATKGIGLALADEYRLQGWRVIATTVEPSRELTALAVRHPESITVRTLDITDRAAVGQLQAMLSGMMFHSLHIVAGVFQRSAAPIWEQSGEEILRLLETNAIGAIRLAELFDSQVPAGGVFTFTSSGMGSITRNDRGDVDLYRVSKVALNMLVRSFAARRAGSGRRALLICPGWAKTDMGGAGATVEVRDSVRGLYQLVAAPTPGQSAAEFWEYTGAIVPW